MTYHTLYHGTSSGRIERILKDGLLPRSEERVGNWKGDLESHAGYVYLSTWMPMYYAAQAGEKDDDFAILKVRVKERDLYPDEDFIIQALARQHGLNAKTLRSMKSLKLGQFKKEALTSLRVLGSVAVKQVRPKDILAHHVVKFDIELWSWMGGDISVSPINYRINGPRYRHRLELLFAEGEDAVRKDIQEERDENRQGWTRPAEAEKEST